MLDNSIALFSDLSSDTYNLIFNIIDNVKVQLNDIPNDLKTTELLTLLSKNEPTPNNPNVKLTIKVNLSTNNNINSSITFDEIKPKFMLYLDLQLLKKTNLLSTKDILNYFIHVATWIERKIEIYRSSLSDTSNVKLRIYKDDNDLPTDKIAYNTKDISDGIEAFMTRINNAKDTLNPSHTFTFSCSSSSSSSSSSNYIVYMLIK